MKLRRFVSALALVLLTGLAAEPALGQRRTLPRLENAAQKGKPPDPRNNLNAVPPSSNGGMVRGQSQPNLRAMAGLPPKWVENLREMPPDRQERFMQNNRAFQNLPPERQAQIRENLENWNLLSPAERDAIRERAQILGRMSPDQRQYLRTTLLPKWQAMAPERRQAINGRLRILQTMGPAAQQTALADARFMQGLSPDERSMLRELNSFRNPRPQR